MRVIAGSARGRRLVTVAGTRVRPTADRVKEALFSIIESRFDLRGMRVLDLYAGSGGLGIEALSRGAAAAVFVEQDAAVARVLRRNLQACGFEAEVLGSPVERALARLEQRGDVFGGVLLDPPYAGGEAERCLGWLAAGAHLGPGAWVAVEHDAGVALEPNVGPLSLILTRRYGTSVVSLFEERG